MPIRSFWQVDYRELGSEWDIVCPGPSLDKTRDEAHSRPTIEVNGALGLAAGPPPGSPAFWASWEAPVRGVHDQALEQRPRRQALVVLTSERARQPWYDWLVAAGQREPVVVGPAREDPHPEAWRGLEAGPAWVLAAQFAVQRGGAQRLRFFGLDLNGTGYAHGVTDPALRSSDAWAGRWVGERNIRQALLLVLDAVGVDVVEVSA